MHIGAKLAVAPVARATPLFLPRPEIIYINVVHYSAPPRTYLLRATPLFRPLWRHCKCTRVPFQPVPPCHGTSYFFSLEVSKVSKVSYLSRFLNQKVWKWHWLIFTPFGALVNALLLFHYEMIKGNKNF